MILVYQFEVYKEIHHIKVFFYWINTPVCSKQKNTLILNFKFFYELCKQMKKENFRIGNIGGIKKNTPLLRLAIATYFEFFEKKHS